MKKYLLLLLLSIFLSTCVQTGTKLLVNRPQETLLNYEGDQAMLPELEIIMEDPVLIPKEQFSSERIIRSYQMAYPNRITEISFRSDDWAMKVYDQWYYWADGKLLPENMISRKDEFNPYPYYNYPEDLPGFQELSQEIKDRLDDMLKNRKTDPLERYPGFLNSLWRIYDRETSWNRVMVLYGEGSGFFLTRYILNTDRKS